MTNIGFTLHYEDRVFEEPFTIYNENVSFDRCTFNDRVWIEGGHVKFFECKFVDGGRIYASGADLFIDGCKAKGLPNVPSPFLQASHCGVYLRSGTVIDWTESYRLPVSVHYGSFLWTNNTEIFTSRPDSYAIYVTSSRVFLTSGTRIKGGGKGYGVVAGRMSEVDVNLVKFEDLSIGVQHQYGSEAVDRGNSIFNRVVWKWRNFRARVRQT